MRSLNQYTGTLKPIQLEGIRAILTERTYTAAATKVGVSRVTLWRWLKDPVFEEAVKAGLRAQMQAIWTDIGMRKI
jgi:predicted DNA-binding protein (UPF0251 family)